MSQAEQATAIVLRLVEEAINGANVEAIDELLAADFVDHAEYMVGPAGEPGDRRTFKQIAAMHQEAISDLRFDVGEVLADGDHVMLCGTVTGRHTGTLYGLPASGNDVAFQVVEMYRVRDGRISDHWWCRDDRDLYREIGALPAALVERVTAHAAAGRVA